MHNLGFYREVRPCQRLGGGQHYEIQSESEPLLIDLGSVATAHRVDVCQEGNHTLAFDEATKVRMKNGDTFYLTIGFDQLGKLLKAQYVLEVE